MLQIEFLDNQVTGIYDMFYACMGGCVIALLMVGLLKVIPFNKKVVEDDYNPVIRVKNKK